MSEIIELKNITKRFGRETALNNVSISVEKGEIFTVLGKNGAGKTTLIKIICTLLLPESGSGNVLGYDLFKEDKKIRANVSLVAPTVDVGVDSVLTVRENLMFWAIVYGLRGREAEKRVDETLKILDLYDVRDRWAMEISAGMRQKLGIGRAILVRHPILFLDEPTVKLDVESKFTIRNFIKDVRDRFGTTILLTTHYYDEAEELSDRIMIIDKGNVLTVDTLQSLKKKLSANEIIFVKAHPSKEQIEKILKRFSKFEAEFNNGVFTFKVPIFSDGMEIILQEFVDKGIEIEEVSSKSPTLEEIFFYVTDGKGKVK
jgi:ABC-2 type transport system ATP-binding protein